MGLPESLVKGTETHGERVSSRFSRGKKVKKKYSTLTERAYRRRRSYVLLRSMIALLIVILALLAGLLIYETRKMKKLFESVCEGTGGKAGCSDEGGEQCRQ